MKRNRKLAAMVASAAALSLIAGSFAYYTATHEVDNTMSTNIYGDTLTEVFQPDSNWEPGEEADKIVTVTNTGDDDIVVRISMSETWTFDDGTTLTIASTDGIVATSGEENYDFQPASTETADQLDADDGLTYETVEGSNTPEDDITTYDGSVVYKDLNSTNWTFNSADGYWYYNSVLTSGSSTEALLSSITLAEDTDMGVYETTTYYAVTDSETAPSAAVTDSETWTVLGEEDTALSSLADVVVSEGYYLHVKSISTCEGFEGYSGATYVLTITSVTCQATEAAVLEEFSELEDTDDIYKVWFPTND